MERTFCERKACQCYWEGLCTLCICQRCGATPKSAVKTISVLSIGLGLVEAALGVWLAIVTCLNNSLPQESQLYFEKFRSPTALGDFFVNESPFIKTPLQNLNFYLFSTSTIAFLGGIGRIIASVFLFVYIRKNSTSDFVSWAWVILSMLAVCSLTLLSLDTFGTLSHQGLSPPYTKDFYFYNDHFGFYFLCYLFKWVNIVDLILTMYFQWVVRWYFRNNITSATTNPVGLHS